MSRFACVLFALTFLTLGCPGPGGQTPTGEDTPGNGGASSGETSDGGSTQSPGGAQAASIQWSAAPASVATGADLRLAFNSTRVGGRDEQNTLHLVWQDGDDIKHGRLADGAAAWTIQPLPKLVSASQAAKPTFAIVAGSQMLAAWSEFFAGQRSIVITQSLDHGQNWDSPLEIARGNYADPITLHAFVRSGGAPGAVIGWDDNSTHRSVASAWPGRAWSAADWTSPATLSSGTTGDSQNVSISGVNETLLAAWKDSRSGAFQIYIAGSTDGGQSWSADRRIPVPTGSSANGSDPSVEFRDAGHVALTWQNQSTVYVASSSDGAVSFSQPQLLGPGLFGHIAVRGQVVAVAWEHFVGSVFDDSIKTVGLAVSLDDLAAIDTPHALPGSENRFSSIQAAVLLTNHFIDVVWVDVSSASSAVLFLSTGQLP